MSNPIIKKYLLKINTILLSPLTISSGLDELTDNDIIRDYDGNPIVPGTSIAGAMRDYCGYLAGDKSYFGYEEGYSGRDDSEKITGRMSSYYISDMEFSGNPDITTRDGVKLSDGKTALTGAKFDYEIIETGSRGSFYIEIVVREADDEEHLLNDIKHSLFGIKNGDIRFGMKKTRGLGKMDIESIYVIAVDKKNVSDWYEAYENIRMEQVDKKEEWLIECESKFIKLEVPLRLTGGISIRRYQAKKNEPDFAHIESNSKPVLPGTSIAGAIRSRIKDILEELEIPNISSLMDKMFGYVDNKEVDTSAAEKMKKNAQISNVIVDEVQLDNSKSLIMVRNGISRFEGSAKQGALFKEKTYVGGETKLIISVRKKQENLFDYMWQIGLLLLAIKDIQNGYLPIGGSTSIGRGIFEGTSEDESINNDGFIKIDNKEIKNETDYSEYYNAVVQLKNGGK